MTNTPSRAGAAHRVRAYIDTGTFAEELGRRVAIRTESQRFPDAGALAERFEQAMDIGHKACLVAANRAHLAVENHDAVAGTDLNLAAIDFVASELRAN